jgi:hypothetical protein
MMRRGKNYQSACKPGSVWGPLLFPASLPAAAIRLGAALLRPSSNHPGGGPENCPRSNPRDFVLPRSTPSLWPPLFGLAPGGVYLDPRRCRRSGALLPHRFTLTALSLHPYGHVPWEAVSFLWHCPWGRPRWPLATTVFPWSPDFPPLDGDDRARPSSSGRPADW